MRARSKPIGQTGINNQFIYSLRAHLSKTLPFNLLLHFVFIYFSCRLRCCCCCWCIQIFEAHLLNCFKSATPTTTTTTTCELRVELPLAFSVAKVVCISLKPLGCFRTIRARVLLKLSIASCQHQVKMRQFALNGVEAGTTMSSRRADS